MARLDWPREGKVMSEKLAKTYGNLWRQWFDEVWGKRDAKAIDTLLAPDGKLHPGPGPASWTPEQFKDFHGQVLSKFSRVEATVHDPIADGNWISVRTELLLVEKGSDEELRVSGLQRAVIRDGRFFEVWDSWDWFPHLEARGTIQPELVSAFLTVI